MFSLLLTLFISLFSIGAPINSIEEPNENDIVLNESFNDKGLYHFNNNMYLGSATELYDSSFVTNLIKLMAVNVGSQTPPSFTISNLLLKFNQPQFIINDNGNISTSGDIYVDTIIVNTATSGSTDYNFNYYRYSIAFKYGSINYFSYTVEWYYPVGVDDYTESFSNYVIGNFSNTGINNFFFIFDRTTSNNQTIYNLLVDMDAYQQYNIGYNDGYTTGYNSGDSNGYNRGYQVGYTDGVSDADIDTTALTIFNGIFDIGLLPVNVFLTIFNFEVFGVNISGILSGLLTLSVVIIIVRLLLGGKKDD